MMIAAKVLIEIDAEGTLHADTETLARLRNQRFNLSIEGERMIFEPVQRRLSEIEDVEERKAAYQEFVKQVARPGPSNLPEDWATIRDSIYD